ncbi:MAG: hypothetical protein M1836_000800 [Candelina mexicana]|nr:MAG: hypothetical protein M1836_000800 [Candelina mexicana]
MKISPSLAYALTVALHFSRAVALPDSTDEADVLSIPVADVLAKNLTPYQSHPLFGTYSNWTQTNEDVQALIANPNDPDVVSPNLIGVDCYPDSPLCFFSSSLKFNGTDEEWQSLVDTYEGPETPDDDESDTPDRMIKRAAKDRRASVHSKTYHRKGLGPSHGHEHYFDYNLKVRSIPTPITFEPQPTNPPAPQNSASPYHTPAPGSSS